MQEGEVVTYVSDDGVLNNELHCVFDILLDESAVSGVIECGCSGIGIRRTRFPKCNNFSADGEANGQDVHMTGNESR